MKNRRQRPVKGGRQRLSPYVLNEVREAVRQAQREYRVSASFVVSVWLADYLGIRLKKEDKL